jgi:hypothetical protein
MIATLRPLSIGEILDGAFVLYRRHLTTLYATALLSVLPGALLGTRLFTGLSGRTGTVLLTAAMLVLIGPAWVLGVFGALQRHISNAMMGRPVDLAEGLDAGLSAAPALWVQGVTLGVLWSIFTLLSVAGVGAGAMGAGGLGVMGAVLAILIWVGGVGGAQLVFFALMFAAPAAVVLEKKGPFAALNRSMELSRDALPRTMAIVGVCGVIIVLPMVGMMVLSGSLPGDAVPGSARMVALQVGSVLIGALTLPYLAACLTLEYYDRRVRTEALDVQLITEQLEAL